MDTLSRRDLFAAGAGGALALAAIGKAEAGDMSRDEKANVALVNAFCKSWGDPATTVEQIMSHMTDDCSFKVAGQPATQGRAAVTALFTTFFKGGTRYDMQAHSTFAYGPVVVNGRTDTTVHPDKRDPSEPVVGIFVFKDGKIREWEEVIYKA